METWVKRQMGGWMDAWMKKERTTGRESGCYSQGQRPECRELPSECTMETVGILKGSCTCKQAHTNRVAGDNARILSGDSVPTFRVGKWGSEMADRQGG